VHVLRSLKQAQYRASADGHYGLAKPDYTHFTSPIRRYADLIVHRVLDSYLHKVGADSALDNPDLRYSQGKLESLAEHVCITERNSVDAERESVKTKLLEFYDRELQKEEKQHFKAVITDVKNHGLFVELTDSLAFGMVHISTLEDDFYHPNEDGTALVGRRRKRSFALAQHIMVQVERVDRFKRQIDFRVVSGSDRETGKSKGKGGRGQGRSGSSKRSPAKSKPAKKAANPRGKTLTKRPSKRQRPSKRRSRNKPNKPNKPAS
jgi:ribonuclease R